MASLASLFDPSDFLPTEPEPKPKGRIRTRRGPNKHEYLPEESSFLCEPNLTTDLLVRDGSYIDSFIAPNRKEEDRKPRRRNSGRKGRRKKKNSKESSPEEGIVDVEEKLEWNNKNCNFKSKVEDVGKNVNDLKYNAGKGRRKEEWVTYEQKLVYNVIEKLEKVNLKDNIYTAGDFNTDDLENDPLYSSDDFDESLDDSLSDMNKSVDESCGTLPPEPRFGNVEYKLQLVNPGEKRLQHLVTQLKWRLRSGGGSAVYVVGVRDCGTLVGLRPRALRASLHTLRNMAGSLHAALVHVTARRVAPSRAVAEVYIRKLDDTHQSVELRVAVMGANEAGKSTLLGVLTQGELDNGRGSARLNMFRHLHEVKSGRTSSLSHEILGFDAQGHVVNYGCSELMTAESIGERSSKLVSFLDLAGHHKYQKTTVHGLTGYSPHYAMLVISATAGVNRMTEEHIALLLALDLPFFIVVTKLDLSQNKLDPLLIKIKEILLAANCDKTPLLITDEYLARNCVAPHNLILDAIDNVTDTCKEDENKTDSVAVFPVSCVRGGGLSALHAYLLALLPPAQPSLPDESCEFQIDEIFHVGESVEPVVGGLLARGVLREGDTLLIGPLDTGDFTSTRVKSIYRNRVPCGVVMAGQSASLGLSWHPPNLRQGMVLLAKNQKSNKHERPPNRGCSGRCAAVARLVSTSTKRNKKKDKNLISDAQICLDKRRVPIEMDHVFKGDNSEVGDKTNVVCSCNEELPLEDPNNPRGCIFFQATVRLLRHSTAIYPGFQATVHVGNVRQTAVIEGILSCNNVLRADESASVVFRFVRQPEYLCGGRKILFRDGLETRGVGRVMQVFPYTRELPMTPDNNTPLVRRYSAPKPRTRMQAIIHGGDYKNTNRKWSLEMHPQNDFAEINEEISSYHFTDAQRPTTLNVGDELHEKTLAVEIPQAPNGGNIENEVDSGSLAQQTVSESPELTRDGFFVI